MYEGENQRDRRMEIVLESSEKEGAKYIANGGRNEESQGTRDIAEENDSMPNVVPNLILKPELQI